MAHTPYDKGFTTTLAWFQAGGDANNVPKPPAYFLQEQWAEWEAGSFAACSAECSRMIAEIHATNAKIEDIHSTLEAAMLDFTLTALIIFFTCLLIAGSITEGIVRAICLLAAFPFLIAFHWKKSKSRKVNKE